MRHESASGRELNDRSRTLISPRSPRNEFATVQTWLNLARIKLASSLGCPTLLWCLSAVQESYSAAVAAYHQIHKTAISQRPLPSIFRLARDTRLCRSTAEPLWRYVQEHGNGTRLRYSTAQQAAVLSERNSVGQQERRYPRQAARSGTSDLSKSCSLPCAMPSKRIRRSIGSVPYTGISRPLTSSSPIGQRQVAMAC